MYTVAVYFHCVAASVCNKTHKTKKQCGREIKERAVCTQMLCIKTKKQFLSQRLCVSKHTIQCGSFLLQRLCASSKTIHVSNVAASVCVATHNTYGSFLSQRLGASSHTIHVHTYTPMHIHSKFAIYE